MTTDSEPKPPKSKPSKLRFRKPPKPAPDCCLNCAAPATGRFCAGCGQEIKDHSVALGPLLSDALAELASWDSKLFRTLIPLLIRPGFLTTEYNAGRRVPYLSPLKLYLTLSVLFFLLLSLKPPVTHDAIRFEPGGVTVGVSTGVSERKAAPTLEEYEAHQKTLPPARRDTAFESAMARGGYKAKQSPSAFISALIGDIPKMMFLLLPLFAVTLKLLYLRTKWLYVEHLIFLLHVHALAFLALSPLALYHPDWLAGILGLALWVYLLVALRVVYKQGWIKTLFKMQAILASYVLLLSLCIAGTLLVALWLL